jgi:hypothetical protein
VSERDVPEYTEPTTFENLSETQQRAFVRATNSSSRTVQASATPLPEYVRKSGSVHQFRRYSTFEWTALGTFLPVLIGLLGAGVVVGAARRSIRK